MGLWEVKKKAASASETTCAMCGWQKVKNAGKNRPKHCDFAGRVCGQMPGENR
ncbi:MAG: hypothetical protein IKM62_04270 [Kiritimatiellae bacterium]|nr:hypothetical protein [Kiritimatiellia bacterium]